MPAKKVLLIAPPYFGMDVSIARAFERNGVEPVLVKNRFDPYLWEKVIIKLIKYIPSSKTALQPFLKSSLMMENKEYVSIAKKHSPAFAFIVKGETVFPETLKYLKEKLAIPCLSYQWDDPFFSFETQQGGDDYRKNNFMRGMNDYEHIFMFDTHYEMQIKKMGMANVSYLPLATDDEMYRRQQLADEEKSVYGYPVSFVGAPFKNRIDIFNALNGFNIGVFGDYWDKYMGMVNGAYFKGKASGEKVLKIYTASEIVLNIHHPQSIYGLNTRTFDIPSCGAFEIVDYKEGIEELFDVAKEIICYRSIDELKELIRYYLTHPGERKAIADRGCRRVRGEHTWYHRVQKVMELVN